MKNVIYAGSLRLPSSTAMQEESSSFMLSEAENGQGKSADDCNDIYNCQIGADGQFMCYKT